MTKPSILSEGTLQIIKKRYACCTMTIGRVIAVHSSKGGVGKSTLTCLLAKLLKERDLKVGICDLDITGPCLKTLMPPNQDFVKWITKQSTHIRYENDKMSPRDPLDTLYPLSTDEDTCLPEDNQYLEPLEVDTVKLMSISFFKSPKSQGFTAFRGPASDQICQILLKRTNWGELNYLILDLPPGTMDIVLSASEHITIDGVIAVTTPHITRYNPNLHSQKITERGLNLFKHLNTTVLALVENMAYFQCSCAKHFIFGNPCGQNLCKNHNIPKYIQLPLISMYVNVSIDDMLKVS